MGRAFARAPIYFYRFGLGRLLGNRFVMIEHIGRVSGLPRQTVLEVIRRDDDSIDVAAAWGPKSDWFRNIIADPSVLVSSGRRRSVPATASMLRVDAATGVFAEYAVEHQTAARTLGRTLELDFADPAKVASAVPIVRLTFD
jgi:deazaflavin-dependent oxidoreductase (nitroreductase family)